MYQHSLGTISRNNQSALSAPGLDSLLPTQEGANNKIKGAWRGFRPPLSIYTISDAHGVLSVNFTEGNIKKETTPCNIGTWLRHKFHQASCYRYVSQGRSSQSCQRPSLTVTSY